MVKGEEEVGIRLDPWFCHGRTYWFNGNQLYGCTWELFWNPPYIYTRKPSPTGIMNPHDWKTQWWGILKGLLDVPDMQRDGSKDGSIYIYAPRFLKDCPHLPFYISSGFPKAASESYNLYLICCVGVRANKRSPHSGRGSRKRRLEIGESILSSLFLPCRKSW